MLKENGITPEGRVEYANPRDALKREEKNCDRNHGRSQNHHQTSCVKRPNEQRQSEPCHSGCSHRMNSYDEVQASEYRRETVDEDAQSGGNHVRIRKGRTERSIESPTCINSAGEQCIDRNQPTSHVDVPAQQIDPRKSEILCTNHHRDNEVSKCCGDRRNQKEENHQDSVLRKDLVVGSRVKEIALRC